MILEIIVEGGAQVGIGGVLQHGSRSPVRLRHSLNPASGDDAGFFQKVGEFSLRRLGCVGQPRACRGRSPPAPHLFQFLEAIVFAPEVCVLAAR